MEPAARTSLRIKTLVLVALTTLGLVAALYLPLRALILGSFLRLEEDVALRDLDRARNALDFDLAQLETTTGDYAVWDDAYAYLDGNGDRFTDVNFVDDTFRNNRLGLVVLRDLRAEVRFAKGFDLVRSRAARAPRDLSFLARL